MNLDPCTTALVMIDLQHGVLGRTLAPHSVADVFNAATELAGRARTAGALVVWVRVAFSADFADAPPQAVDQPMQRPPGGFLAAFSEFPEDLVGPTDLVITKRQWGAFYGTELDLQLRRRGIRTIVLGGVATNFGVESTARDAWEHGYQLVIAEDATSSHSAELHEFSIRHILPRLAVISTSSAVSFQEG